VDLTFSRLDVAPVSHEWTQKPFLDSPGFSSTWWVGGAKGPLVFCSFMMKPVGEVARAQVKPRSSTGEAYPSWTRPRLGSTEIDLLEVRTDLRGRGIGREAVARLLVELPLPFIVLSLNQQSDAFWRSLGWAEHTHADAADYHPEGPRPALLFVRPD
jgi:hypothetical protein